MKKLEHRYELLKHWNLKKKQYFSIATKKLKSLKSLHKSIFFSLKILYLCCMFYIVMKNYYILVSLDIYVSAAIE